MTLGSWACMKQFAALATVGESQAGHKSANTARCLPRVQTTKGDSYLLTHTHHKTIAQLYPKRMDHHIVFKAWLGFDLMSTGNKGYLCAQNASYNHMKVVTDLSYNIQPPLHSDFFYSVRWAPRHDSNTGGEASDWLGTCSVKQRPVFCQFKLWRKIFLRVK